MTKISKLATLFLLLISSLLSANSINIDEKLLRTNNDDRHVLVFLHRIGCSYCNSMEEFTLDEESVKEYIAKNYEFITINISTDQSVIYKGEESTGLEFAIKMGYNFYPSTLFLLKDEGLAFAYPGYVSEDDFLLILRYVNSKSYKNMDIESYKNATGYKKSSEDEIVDKRKYDR